MGAQPGAEGELRPRAAGSFRATRLVRMDGVSERSCDREYLRPFHTLHHAPPRARVALAVRAGRLHRGGIDVLTGVSRGPLADRRHRRCDRGTGLVVGDVESVSFHAGARTYGDEIT